jgi:hypothetical protein
MEGTNETTFWLKDVGFHWWKEKHTKHIPKISQKLVLGYAMGNGWE